MPMKMGNFIRISIKCYPAIAIFHPNPSPYLHGMTVVQVNVTVQVNQR